MGERPIANKYREGKMKRTLKRELKGPEIVSREPIKTGHTLWDRVICRWLRGVRDRKTRVLRCAFAGGLFSQGVRQHQSGFQVMSGGKVGEPKRLAVIARQKYCYLD